MKFLVNLVSVGLDGLLERARAWQASVQRQQQGLSQLAERLAGLVAHERAWRSSIRSTDAKGKKGGDGSARENAGGNANDIGGSSGGGAGVFRSPEYQRIYG